jgi:hypothetical protein
VVLPILMLAGFVFVNIPMLDAHLHEHYGTAFDKYAAMQRIPLDCFLSSIKPAVFLELSGTELGSRSSNGQRQCLARISKDICG